MRGAGGRGGAGQRGHALAAPVAPVLSPGHLPGAGQHRWLWPGEGGAGGPAPHRSPGHGGLPPPAARTGRGDRAGEAARARLQKPPGCVCTEVNAQTHACTKPRVYVHAQSHGHPVGAEGGRLQAPVGQPSSTSEPSSSQGGPGRATPRSPAPSPSPPQAGSCRGALPTPRGFLSLLASTRATRPRASPRSLRTHGAAR